MIYTAKKYTNSLLPKKEWIKTGFNSLKISTFKMIDEDDYFEDINIGNWVDIQEDSYVHIEYEEDTENILLKSFPYPFLKEEMETLLIQLL
ncbi:hypothetical protein PL321_06870 [Caloramator sp. mosi_1]|uniref:hypothetical protein n=1 Tax=Caloramator sp. mosi_1 TaxID=3023090 RepID=UPI002362BF73|nr:hypothetical protein [Caloramator sp. mosi_1]WDC85934.1 hypothetical protein PL321_06870 [Caloramator sp. mosi_1]